MAACTNNGGSRARRAVTAALVGVLSVGTVPMAAVAQGVADGIAPLFITEGNAFEGATVEATFSHGSFGKKTFSNATDDVCDLNYVENVPVALDEVTIDFAGTSDKGDLVIDADAEDDDYTVAYYRRGDDGKPADDNAITSDIVFVGKYVAVVTPKSGTTYDGNVLYIPFDINERVIPNVQVVDDTVTYNAEAHDFAFTSNGTPLTEGLDYDVYYVEDGHGYTEDEAVDVRNVGKYVAVLMGKGAYEGTVQLVKGIEVKQLDLSSLTNDEVQGVVSASETEPENTFAITIDGKVYQGDDPIMSELKGDIDLTVAQPTGTTWKNNGTYLYKLQAADPNNDNIANSKQFYAFKVDNEVSFSYDGAALSDMDLVIDDGILWDSSKVSASGQDGTVDGATISWADGQIQGKVYKEDGTLLTGNFANQVATMNGNAGTYYVQLWVDGSANGYELGGQTMVKVTVYQDAVDADAKAAVLYDVDGDGRDEVVSSVSTTYQKGRDVKGDITVSVKDSAGNTLYENRGDYAVTYYNEDGIAVSRVEDAGTYTLKLTSSKYKLSGTTEMTVTVSPMDLSTVRSSKVDNAHFDHAGTGDYDYLPWRELSYTIGGTTNKSWSLGLQYLTAGGDAADNADWANLPMDVVKVAITKDGAEVERIDSEGVYVITFEARNADAENNYVIPADLTLTCVKDGTDGSADHTRFADVRWNDYYVDSVTWVSDRGRSYMTGYGNSNVFGAWDDITRADVVGTLYKMAGGERLHLDDVLYDTIVGWKSFDDVDGTQYYGRAIAWAKSMGIVNGHDGKFRPDETITREEFAGMLANYADKYGTFEPASEDALDSVSDGASVSDWAVEAVSWAVENGIMGNAGVVDPQSNIRRADVAGMIWHFAE